MSEREPNRDIERQLERLDDALRERLSLPQRVLDRLQTLSAGESENTGTSLNPRRAPSAQDGTAEASGEVVAGRRTRRLTVFQTLSICGATATVLLIALVWFASSGASVSFAQVCEKIELVTSYSFEMEMVGEDEEESRTKWNIFWRAPDSHRIEIGGPNQDKVRISFRAKPGIVLDRKAKTYVQWPAERGRPVAASKSMRDLIHMKDKATERLGRKLVDGSECEGFEIKSESIRIWVDAKTLLPVRMVQGRMVQKNYQWNPPLDDTLFLTVPPEEYVQKQIPELFIDTDKLLADIVAAFELYAELSGGRYPQTATIVSGPVLQEMLRLAGFSEDDDPAELVKDEQYKRIMQTSRAWSIMTSRMWLDPDTTYHGLTVTPNDNGKVLFRWHVRGREFYLIYGDLQTEKVEE